MTLENLLGRSLERVQADKQAVARLLVSISRNINDAELTQLSTENRFDVAYKAIMQLAMLALHANGYRTLTSRPGHHQTAIQSLPVTIGLHHEQMVLLDGLRKQRNLADYSGDPISESTMRTCIGSAKELFDLVKAWLKAHKPELL